MSLNVMAWLRSIFTRFEDAADLFDLALAKSEAVGDELQIVMALGNFAQARVAAKDTIQARKAVERAFALLRASGSTYEAHELFEILSRCSMADGDTVAAAEHVGAADALRESMHVPLWGPLFDRHERLVTDLRAALGDAAFAMAYDRGRRAKV